jgi:hypothetical protein
MPCSIKETSNRKPMPRRVDIRFVAVKAWTIPVRQLSTRKEIKA